MKYIGNKGKNEIEIKENLIIVETTRGRFEIDKEDLNLIKNYTWHMTPTGYVYTTIQKTEGKRGSLYLHRLIINAKEGEFVDHIDRNKANNRKSNLRIVDVVINGANKVKYKELATSKYKGVRFIKGEGWCARITVNGKEIGLGTYTNEEAAANAYNYYGELYLGEYIVPNECKQLLNWFEYRNSRRKITKYRGVRKKERSGKVFWEGVIFKNCKPKYLGKFDTEDDAARAFNLEAINRGFEIPKLNIINGVIDGLTEEILLKNYRYVSKI